MMRFRTVVLLSALLGAATGCTDDAPDRDATRLSLHADAALDPSGDPAHVDSAWVLGDELHLRVAYSGGCREHGFALTGRTAFLESQPPQLDIFLAHDDRGDECDAVPTVELTFNVSAAQALHRSQYGAEGPLYLRLHWNDLGGPGALGRRIVAYPGPAAERSTMNPEAELLDVYHSGELLPSRERAATYAAELQAIRTEFAEELGELADVPFHSPWGERMIVAMTHEAYAAPREPGVPHWRDLVDLLALEPHPPYFTTEDESYISIDSPLAVNNCRLVDLFRTLPGVTFGRGSDLGGDWSSIYPHENGEGSTDYFIRLGSDGCPAGCIRSRVAYVRSEAGELKFSGIYDTFSDGPLPSWWPTYLEAGDRYQSIRFCGVAAIHEENPPR